MARGELKRRLDALEVDRGPRFTGYACVEVYEDQTVADAKAAWEAANGPFGTRQIVLWNFGGRSSEEWKAVCASK